MKIIIIDKCALIVNNYWNRMKIYAYMYVKLSLGVYPEAILT